MKNSVLCQRIKELCARYGMSVSGLETKLGLAASSINKWEKGVSPSVDKIEKISTFFDVSVDYLLGKTDIRTQVEDSDIISIQRAREKMSEQDQKRMMNMLRAGFDYAFGDESKND